MDWSSASEDMIVRIVAEGESYLDGQLRLATSADQRASVLAGVFTAAGTVILAGLITLTASKDIPLPQQFPLYLGGGMAVFLFLFAAGYCIAAIFPIGFWLPGNQPRSWYRDVETGKTLKIALGEEAENIQEKIEDNRKILAKNARRFMVGAGLGISAPVIGTLFWVISSSSLWLAR